MSSALMVDAVVRDGDVHVTGDHYRARRQRAAKRWGDGAMLVIRIEPADEAYTHAQMKHLFGHIYTPLSEWNGDFVTEWHLLLKAAFLPDGKTSLTQCNRDELDAYIQQCEVYAHTAHPEAFALYEQAQRA